MKRLDLKISIAKVLKNAVLPALLSMAFVVTSCDPKWNDCEEPIPICGTPTTPVYECGIPVTAVNVTCGAGQWGALWFKSDSGEYLQPCMIDPSFNVLNIQEGERYLIGYEEMTRPACNQVVGNAVICQAVPPEATPVSINCIEFVSASFTH